MTIRSLLLSTFFFAAASGLAAQEVTLTVANDDDALRDFLRGNSAAVTQAEEEDARASDLIAAARADYRRILTGLYAEGYYGGTISILVDGREAAAIPPLDAPAAVNRIEIRVTPGPLFTFGRTSVSPIVETTETPAGFATGQTARSGLVSQAVANATDAWRAQGHALAAAGAQTVTADHRDNRLDVAVAIEPGPRLSFAPLVVQGNERVRTERIVEIAGLRPNRVFDPEEVALASQRLRRTGAFDSVALIEAETAGPGDTLTVTAQVAEMAPRRLGFGAEISTTEGLALTGYWMHRNLLGGAERFRVDLGITGIEGAADSGDDGPDYSIGLSYGRPATLNPDTDLTINVNLSREDEPDYLLTQAGFDVGFIKYVRADLTYQLGLGYLTAREETDWRRRDYTLITLPMRATLDRRNDRFNATSGFYADLTATPFYGVEGGDDGARVYSDTRYYHTFGERVTLAGRAQIGSVMGSALLRTPTDFLFYSGGGGTVRGQPYQSLGITLNRDEDGPVDRRVGGRSFVGAQLEARVGVTDSIGLVGFYDFGAIDIESLPTEDAEWQAGAGLGLRYNTAIGPIRLDLATPASGDDAGEKLLVYIGIGQAF